MADVQPDETITATWCGPFVAELTDGKIVAPGETVDVPAGQAIPSGHYETDDTLDAPPAPTELPAPDAELTAELLEPFKLEELHEIAASRNVEVTGTGAGGRVLKGDLVTALLAPAAPDAAGDPPAGEGETHDQGGEA